MTQDTYNSLVADVKDQMRSEIEKTAGLREDLKAGKVAAGTIIGDLKRKFKSGSDAVGRHFSAADVADKINTKNLGERTYNEGDSFIHDMAAEAGPRNKAVLAARVKRGLIAGVPAAAMLGGGSYAMGRNQ